jgi:hypothetical protein
MDHHEGSKVASLPRVQLDAATGGLEKASLFGLGTIFGIGAGVAAMTGGALWARNKCKTTAPGESAYWDETCAAPERAKR